LRVDTYRLSDNGSGRAVAEQAIRHLARLIREATKDARALARVRATALKIVYECEARNDECELQAIFEAVKHGTPLVKGLSRGLPYRADPKFVDFFVRADRTLDMCESGSCGGDCDDATALVASLARSVGFTVGARAYGRSRDDYVHVYPVALIPKKANHPHDPGAQVVGMDTTVESSYLGWQPPPGVYLDAWIID
jgi:hypothetical protein